MSDDKADPYNLGEDMLKIIEIFQKASVPQSEGSAGTKAALLRDLRGRRRKAELGLQSHSTPHHGIDPAKSPHMKVYADDFQAQIEYFDKLIASLKP